MLASLSRVQCVGGLGIRVQGAGFRQGSGLKV